VLDWWSSGVLGCCSVGVLRPFFNLSHDAIRFLMTTGLLQPAWRFGKSAPDKENEKSAGGAHWRYPTPAVNPPEVAKALDCSFAQAPLAIGYWLLAIGYWLLAIGYWLLAIRTSFRRVSIMRCYCDVFCRHLRQGGDFFGV
jgi:hypothetical protein